MIAEVSTVTTYVGWVTAGFTSISAIVIIIIQNYNNKAQNKATVRKTEVDIANAIIDRISKENERLQKECDNKDKKILEILKAHQESIDLNSKLVQSNETQTEQIHQLEIKVQQLSNEIQLLTLKIK